MSSESFNQKMIEKYKKLFSNANFLRDNCYNYLIDQASAVELLADYYQKLGIDQAFLQDSHASIIQKLPNGRANCECCLSKKKEDTTTLYLPKKPNCIADFFAIGGEVARYNYYKNNGSTNCDGLEEFFPLFFESEIGTDFGVPKKLDSYRMEKYDLLCRKKTLLDSYTNLIINCAYDNYFRIIGSIPAKSDAIAVIKGEMDINQFKEKYGLNIASNEIYEANELLILSKNIRN